MARQRWRLVVIWFEMSRDVPGYKVDAVEAWIAKHIQELQPPFTWTQLKGGHSNLTYRLTDQAGQRVVVRRPPEGELLPKAHDMSREWSLISALAETPVPAPAPLAFCEAPDVTGAWFYVMSWVEGAALHGLAEVEAHVPETERGVMAFSLVDALAALHTLDPDKIGLGGLAKRDGYIARQMRAWYRSWTSSVEIGGYEDQRAHDLKLALERLIPATSPVRIVHGDCGLHNVLVGNDHKIAAILDWEIATLGDPLADTAYALNTFADSEDALPLPAGAQALAAGFPSRAELARRYAEKTGENLDALDFYYAFNHWKTAAIIQGVCARYQAGNKNAAGVDIEALMERVERGLVMAEQAITRL